MFIMLPCSQRTLILVLEHMGIFGVRLPPGCSRYGVRVPCSWVRMLSLYATGWPVFPKCMQLTLVSWYVASMLCCHCWMFSLSDALPMQSYPSNVWVLCQCGVTYLLSFLPICISTWNGGISWLKLWRCWLHSCGMFNLLVEYGLVHRGDCINCGTCYFCFDPAFVWPSLARRLSLCLACKPFPGLRACTRTGRWCVSVVAIRSLSLFTNRADRRSQISSLDSASQ